MFDGPRRYQRRVNLLPIFIKLLFCKIRTALEVYDDLDEPEAGHPQQPKEVVPKEGGGDLRYLRLSVLTRDRD